MKVMLSCLVTKRVPVFDDNDNQITIRTRTRGGCSFTGDEAARIHKDLKSLDASTLLIMHVMNLLVD